jgi:uncharacterized membrane protein
MNRTNEHTTGNLVAVEFDDELKAKEVLLAFLRLQKRKSLFLEDAAIVTNNRKVRILQTRDTNPSQGAVRGSWWGLLAGLVFGYAIPAALLGAAIGALWAWRRDIGISDRHMKELGRGLRHGDAAAFFLVKDAYPTHLVNEFRRFDGRILHTTFDAETREQFEEALSYAA